MTPPPPPPPRGLPADAVPAAARPLLDEQYSGITVPRRAIIRDAAEWGVFWAAAIRGRAPAPPVPTLDFTQEMVIAVALGPRPTGGYRVGIDRVYRTAGDVLVVVRETAPPPGAMTVQAQTAPVVAVAVPRSDGPVKFLDA